MPGRRASSQSEGRARTRQWSSDGTPEGGEEGQWGREEETKAIERPYTSIHIVLFDT